VLYAFAIYTAAYSPLQMQRSLLLWMQYFAVHQDLQILAQLLLWK
jgi:hypothetical protein